MTRTIQFITLSLLGSLALPGCMGRSTSGGDVHADATVAQPADSAPGFSTSECPAGVKTHGIWTCTRIDAAPAVALPGGTFQPEPACLGHRPFGFFSRIDPESRDLLIHLQAGGHCIGDQCKQWLENRGTAAENAPTNGVFNPARDDNPFAHYSQVRIPYCSGDTHAGHVTLTEEGVEGWQQHGFDNVVATLDYISQTYGDQLRGGRVVFAGSSAGGIGTILDSPLLPQFFPDSTISVLSDSAAGVQSCYDMRTSYDAWDLEQTLGLMGTSRAPTCSPSTEPGAPPSELLSGFAVGLWADNIDAHPDWTFAYVGSAHDKSQSTMSVNAEVQVCAECTFENAVTRLLDCAAAPGSGCPIDAPLPSLSSFVYGGTQHTILANDDIYEKRDVVEVGGGTVSISVASWLGQWLETEVSYACPTCRERSDCASCPAIPCACPKEGSACPVQCPPPQPADER